MIDFAKPDYTVLLICDDTFHTSVREANTYIEKLLRFLSAKEQHNTLILKTISGRYGLKNDLPEIPVQDKNRRLFVNSVADYLEEIDEVIFITNYPRDHYLLGLITLLKDEQKPTGVYSYETLVKRDIQMEEGPIDDDSE